LFKIPSFRCFFLSDKINMMDADCFINKFYSIYFLQVK